MFMLTSNFYRLLETLKDPEVAAFHLYLKRVHAKKEIPLSLFAYIRRMRNKKKKQLHPAAFYRKLYGEDIADLHKSVLNTLSELYGLLREFLVQEKVKTRSFESQLLWLAVLQERGLEAEFTRQAQQLLDDLAARQKCISSKDYLNNLVAQHFRYFDSARGTPAAEVTAQEAYTNALQLYWTACSSKAECAAKTMRRIRPDNPERTAGEVRLAQDPDTHPLPSLYHDVSQLIDQPDESLFQTCVDRIQKQADQIAPNELNVLIRYLSNYASAQVRKGNETVWGNIHLLNQVGIKHDIFTQAGEMPAAQFLNIVNTACKVRQFDWIPSFITEQDKQLHVDIREETTLLANTMIAFERKEYKLVIKNLQDATLKDISLQLRAKTMLLIGLYETEGHGNDLFSFCLNFELFLKRHQKELAEAVRGVSNFVRFVKILVQKKLPRQQLIDQITNTEVLYFKPWLLEKALKYQPVHTAHPRSR